MVEMLIPLRLNPPRVKAKKTPNRQPTRELGLHNRKHKSGNPQKILLSSHQKNRKSSFRIRTIQLTLQEQYPKIRVEKLLNWQKFKVGVENLNSKFIPTSPRLVKPEKKYALRHFLRNLQPPQTQNKYSLKQNWHEKLK